MPAGMSDDVSNISRTDTPEGLKYRQQMPTTYQPPKDGFLFFTTKEAETVGKIKLGCTGYHLFKEDRHGDKPLLYSALIADPSDLEKQNQIPQFRPCADERELRFAMNELGISTETDNSFYIDKPEGDGSEVTTFNPQGEPAETPPPPAANQQMVSTNQATRGNSNTVDFEKKLNKVYVKKEENMSETQNLTGLEQALTENIQLKEQITYAEQAINLAAKHIEKTNASLVKLKELQEFKDQAEAIINEAYDNQTAQDRLATMKEIVGDSYNEDDLAELKGMSEAAFAELKKAVAKVSKKIEKTITEQEIITKATAAIKEASKQKQVSPVFVLESTPGKKEDAAKTLIDHAMRRR